MYRPHHWSNPLKHAAFHQQLKEREDGELKGKTKLKEALTVALADTSKQADVIFTTLYHIAEKSIYMRIKSTYHRSDPAKHAVFHQQFKECEDSELEGKTKLKEAIAVFQADTLRQSDVIFTTLYRAAEKIMYENTDVKLVIMEESGRATESQMLQVPMHYPKAIFLLVGDTMQLQPLTFGQDGFALQRELSLFTRLIWSGFPKMILSEQHRMHERISNQLKTLFKQDYHNLMRPNPNYIPHKNTKICERFIQKT